ncbi:MAG: hypothetical protein IJ479_01875, partial [Alphaproteobacteria bacterium]|nr:hypothetical protein [Alphaproteobacteria bacterium]
PNGKPYYKGCKEDRPRACREAGYVNSCSPGRLYATTNRCQWDNSYGKCCTASPSAGCPSDYAVTCDPARGSSGADKCGYTCYRCCDDTCPSGTSKNYTGSYASTTECGSRCNRCKGCPSGTSTSYSGSYASSSECGSCYYCSDTCRSGTKGGASCSGNYVSTRISSTECGSGCYECRYNTDCSATDKDCDYGCAYTNSCGKCTSCNSCSNSCSTGSTYVSCSSGQTKEAVGTTQCGNTCYKCTTNNSSSDGGNSSCTYDAKIRYATATACQDNRGESGCSYKLYCGMIAATCSYDLYKNGSVVSTYYTRVNGYSTIAECEANRSGDSCSGGLSEAMSAAKKLCN